MSTRRRRIDAVHALRLASARRDVAGPHAPRRPYGGRPSAELHAGAVDAA
ncbi:MAG: hypothetical protein KF764_01340 [Labilithrix sp.]|nr:hypothetical protein [Labilithrix sp.]